MAPLGSPLILPVDTVNCIQTLKGWYLDHLSTEWQGMYTNDPAKGVAANATHLVLGGQGEMWGETVDASDIESTVWPRMAAIAEMLWSPANITTCPSTPASSSTSVQQHQTHQTQQHRAQQKRQQKHSGWMEEGEEGYEVDSTSVLRHGGRDGVAAAPSPLQDCPQVNSAFPRLTAFRCLLNRRGVKAAPVNNRGARTSPPGPGSCINQ
jgi:hypothetical protein